MFEVKQVANVEDTESTGKERQIRKMEQPDQVGFIRRGKDFQTVK